VSKSANKKKIEAQGQKKVERRPPVEGMQVVRVLVRRVFRKADDHLIGVKVRIQEHREGGERIKGKKEESWRRIGARELEVGEVKTERRSAVLGSRSRKGNLDPWDGSFVA